VGILGRARSFNDHSQVCVSILVFARCQSCLLFSSLFAEDEFKTRLCALCEFSYLEMQANPMQ
jgi:hypothetical protein